MNRLRRAWPTTVIQFRTTEALLDSAGRALDASADPEVAGRLVRQAADALASLGVALLQELPQRGAEGGHGSWVTIHSASWDSESPQRRELTADGGAQLEPSRA